MENVLAIRFFGDLNDFLPPSKKQIAFNYSFFGTPTVKDIVESLGVPHTEIDLILVNGQSVSFEFKAKKGDYVTVYPTLSLRGENLIHLQPILPLHLTFIVDANLGKLARFLRMVGFDTLYNPTFSDVTLIEIALAENRMLLTRDLGILKNKKVTYGYFVRNTYSRQQLKEVLKRFSLKEKIEPLTRCLECNTLLTFIEKEKIASQLEPETRKTFDKFLFCRACQKVYWEGSHFEKMKKLIEEIYRLV